ncbi:MAG TPA: hypothetical protein DCW29_07740 [Janthinobacterium sp.]|nr:hypothetical protein [Janthinobacterium sp.]
MRALIEDVKRIRNVGRSELSGRVRNVLVILGNSRSGSSLVKRMLAGHPDIATLDGEMEALLALTGNGFGDSGDSDAIGVLHNRLELADNIFAELSVPVATRAASPLLKKQWENRLLLQFPVLFTQPGAHAALLRALDEALLEGAARGIAGEEQWQGLILATVFREQPWRLQYYDGKAARDSGRCFDEALKIEEPPFVVPRQYGRACTAADLECKILLFKAPADVYRIGMYEQLFPQARVDYLHLSRGYAQSVNGLMDGWLSPVGFFSHDLRRVGVRLDIKGYSELLPFGRHWWKFDLPPNWRQFTASGLDEVCLNQWLASHQAILGASVAALRLRFEDFLAAPPAFMRALGLHLGLSPFAVPAALPVTMATEAPRPMRWKKREAQLLALGERREVRAMMETLGYAMNPAGWQ